MHLHLDMGVAAFKLPQQAIELFMAAGGDLAQMKNALVPRFQIADFLPGRAFQLQHFQGIAVKTAPRFRRYDLPGPPFKEGAAKLLSRRCIWLDRGGWEI